MVVKNEHDVEPRLTVREVLLPAAAVLAAILGALPVFSDAWLAEWRTGVLFAASAVVIVAGQAFLMQYFAVRAYRSGLVEDVRGMRAEADALLAAVKASRAPREEPR